MSRTTYAAAAAAVLVSICMTDADGALPPGKLAEELSREFLPGMRSEFGASRGRGRTFFIDPSRAAGIAIGYIEWSGVENVAERGGVAHAMSADPANAALNGLLAGLVSLVDIRLAGGVAVFLGMNETSPLDRRSAIFAYDPLAGEVLRLSPRDAVTLPARSFTFGIEIPFGADENARVGLELFYAFDDRRAGERSWAVGLTWRAAGW